MASSIHIKVDGIPGDSTEKLHPKEIDVENWNWGVSNAGQAGGVGGRGAGKPSFADLTFVHHVDRATPKLWDACATGLRIPEAKLSSAKVAAGGAPKDYLIITMKDVVVTAVSAGESQGGGSPTEQVSLRFASVDLEYKPQKPNGMFEPGIHFKHP
jgi:type VI secretion system secreted protein Hcp